MTELIDRYVHQVGRYLPAQTRADITAELRSQIQDQLDDRYPAEPTTEQVAAVLRELGSPRQIAASYREPQYLIGPDLYPTLIEVLRYGWVIIPAVLVFLGIFGRVIAPTDTPIINWLVETLWGTGQVALIFSGVVVLLFALLQHTGLNLASGAAFDPLTLPAVNDPRTVERRDISLSLAMGVIVMLVWLYFLRVGGLTLRFDITNPGTVLPVPSLWLVLFIVVGSTLIGLHLLVLRRNQWSAWLWLIETLLEVFGSICLYFIFYQPLLAGRTPLPLPEILAAGYAIGILVSHSGRLIALWKTRDDRPLAFANDRR